MAARQELVIPHHEAVNGVPFGTMNIRRCLTTSQQFGRKDPTSRVGHLLSSYLLLFDSKFRPHSRPVL